MPAGFTNITVLDGNGAAKTVYVYDTTGTGPYAPATVVTDGGGHILPAGNVPANAIFFAQTDGTNLLGTSTHPVRIDPIGGTTQPVSGTVDIGNDVTLNSLPAGTALVGKVGIDQTTPGTTNGVSIVGAPTGGSSPYSLLCPGTTNATNVKGSAGTMKGLSVSNVGATPVWVKFYDTASTPTPGSGTPVLRFMIPGATTGAGNNLSGPPEGYKFSSGIAFTTTANIADNDATAITANQVIINFGYE